MENLSKHWTIWSEADIAYLKENARSASLPALAAALNRTETAVRVFAGKHRIYLKDRTNEYALYKGDKLLAVGGVKDIAAQLDLNPSTIWRYRAPSYLKRAKGNNVRRLIKLEKGEDE